MYETETNFLQTQEFQPLVWFRYFEFVPTYACTFMDEIETKILQAQEFQPSVFFRYIDNDLFIWLFLYLVTLNHASKQDGTQVTWFKRK